jgi:hypothetical protein
MVIGDGLCAKGYGAFLRGAGRIGSHGPPPLAGTKLTLAGAWPAQK